MVTQEEVEHWKALPATRLYLRKLEQELLSEKQEAWKQPSWEQVQVSKGRILALSSAIDILKTLKEE